VLSSFGEMVSTFAPCANGAGGTDGGLLASGPSRKTTPVVFTVPCAMR
jgi:hypothetical protein